MSKSKNQNRKGTILNALAPGEVKDILEGSPLEIRDFKILEAKMKDGFCHYKFKVIKGVGLGDKLDVKGAGLYKDTMPKAFTTLNVHMAVIDDVFKHSGIEIEDIDTLHNDDHALIYHVSGFKIVGDEENESIILSGNKYVSVGGRVDLDMFKVSITDHSPYKWYNELKVAIEKVCEEVALYREGNYIPVEPEEDKVDPDQMEMDFKNNDRKVTDEEFEKAEV